MDTTAKTFRYLDTEEVALQRKSAQRSQKMRLANYALTAG
jgi:hypothetical protein